MINHRPDNYRPGKPQLSNVDKIKVLLARLGRNIGRFFSELPNNVKDFISGYRSKNSQKIRRVSRERVYRLKGYTTVAKIDRKRQAERQQRLLRKFLFLIIAALILILMFIMHNPFKDLSELRKIVGIDSVSDLTQPARDTLDEDSDETTSETSLVIVIDDVTYDVTDEATDEEP